MMFPRLFSPTGAAFLGLTSFLLFSSPASALLDCVADETCANSDFHQLGDRTDPQGCYDACVAILGDANLCTHTITRTGTTLCYRCPSGFVAGAAGGGNLGCTWRPDPTVGNDPGTTTVGAGEDPHFKTWSGSFYDYMGECDLTLIHAPFFDEQKNQTMTIAIRTRIRREYSYIETAAVKIGEEIMQVSSFGDYALNGVSTAKLPASISGYNIHHTQLNKKAHIFTIELGNNNNDGESIILRTFKDWVSVKLSNPSKARYHQSYGMMGEFGSGKLLGRDGVTEITNDPNALAAEWQVRDDEPMLFQAARRPQYPQACKLPDPNQKIGRRLGENTVSVRAAEKACVAARAENLNGCIHDVMATGDLDVAAAGAF